MDITHIISQLKEGATKRNYHYHCCDREYDGLYEFRKHIYECHKEEYADLVPFFHHDKPVELTKEERRSMIKKSLKRKKLAKKGKKVRVKVDYSKQPSAWIIYNHNGPKVK